MMQTLPVILINRLGALGDVILTTPIVRKVFYDHGGLCQIIVRTYWADVFKNNPYVSKVIDGSQPIDFSKIDKFINLDLAYEKNPRMHIVDAYAAFAFGFNNFDRQCELHTTAKEIELASRLKQDVGGAYIVIHMRNTHQENRNIPIDFWNKLVIGILSRASLPLIQVGANADHAFGGSELLFDMRNKFTIQELREVIANSDLFIGVDSAPLHIAATTSVEIAAFFTSAHADFRKPIRPNRNFSAIKPEIECYGCQVDLPVGSTVAVCRRGDNECVNRFDVESVISVVLSKINSNRR